MFSLLACEGFLLSCLIINRATPVVPETVLAKDGSYLDSKRITFVFQDFPSSAWVPKPRYNDRVPGPAANNLYFRISRCQPWYLSLGT